MVKQSCTRNKPITKLIAFFQIRLLNLSMDVYLYYLYSLNYYIKKKTFGGRTKMYMYMYCNKIMIFIKLNDTEAL
jgi:hypothetical protein